MDRAERGCARSFGIHRRSQEVGDQHLASVLRREWREAQASRFCLTEGHCPKIRVQRGFQAPGTLLLCCGSIRRLGMFRNGYRLFVACQITLLALFCVACNQNKSSANTSSNSSTTSSSAPCAASALDSE